MTQYAPVITAEPVFERLAQDLQACGASGILVVMDENTRAACGTLVENALRAAGLAPAALVLPGAPIVAADETSIARVLQVLDGKTLALVAVGSGTITDIVRFVAYQTRLPFYSVPTAASVDAFTSYTAAITIGGVKYSFPTKTASGVYIHLPVLCAAPRRMTAAGFSDMAAKYTGLADWELAHLLVDDAYDAEVALQSRKALDGAVAQAERISEAAPEGISGLVDSLVVSGNCMVAVKSSRPAAGAEHSLAHFWEIRHQQKGLPPSLHGEKTGVAAVLVACLYASLRALSPAEVQSRLEAFSLPDPAREAAQVCVAYGNAGADLLTTQASFLGALRPKAQQVAARLVERWDQVQAIAAKVPSPEEITVLLERAGSLTHPGQIHVSAEEINLAYHYAMYVRNRFTILELNRMLGLWYG